MVYLLNHSPTKSLIGRTPYEACHKKRLSVRHLRTLECLVHVNIVHPHVMKLDDRSTTMVMIGYELGTKAYRCYNPRTSKLHISRDVIFEENKC